MSAAYGEHGAVLTTTGEARTRVSWSAILYSAVSFLSWPFRFCLVFSEPVSAWVW
jgi:hypothetical protein